ncbi:hypothetical protein FGO68_gene6041 [Halteria grandinella]|uniref:Uncharacterized protein n=1 Tax=Halteria grandinella TaxID=5974 RepID=A0A8J8T1Q6_HALGN|nr:hypothetical protein FGO68_gene6041 [Halteria grandinella]
MQLHGISTDCHYSQPASSFMVLMQVFTVQPANSMPEALFLTYPLLNAFCLRYNLVTKTIIEGTHALATASSTLLSNPAQSLLAQPCPPALVWTTMPPFSCAAFQLRNTVTSRRPVVLGSASNSNLNFCGYFASMRSAISLAYLQQPHPPQQLMRMKWGASSEPMTSWVEPDDPIIGISNIQNYNREEVLNLNRQ